MNSPPAAPGAGGRPQQRPQRPQSKTGRPDGGTTGRHDLAKHARFAEISPEVGVLDEQAMSRALADDPAAFELLAAMTRATDENLRAAAIRLSASIVLERARAGRPVMGGISRLRTVRGAVDGDLDIDASIDGVAAARAEARPVSVEDLVTVQWARAQTAFAVVVDRSGSMTGARLAAAATVAAACALRAPQEHAVLSFAGTVEVIRPLVSDTEAAAVTERLLRLRGHGVTRLGDALKAAGEQLASARARRRVVILLSDRPGPGRADHPGARRRSRAGRAPGRPGRRPLGRDHAPAGRRRRPGPPARDPRHILTGAKIKIIIPNGPGASSPGRSTPPSPAPGPRRRHRRPLEVPGRRVGDRGDRVRGQLRGIGEPDAALPDQEGAERRSVPVFQLAGAVIGHQVHGHGARGGQPDGEDHLAAGTFEDEITLQFDELFARVDAFGQPAGPAGDDVPEGADDSLLARAGAAEEDVDLDAR
jgi:Mg-chelatase subunit ChlD